MRRGGEWGDAGKCKNYRRDPIAPLCHGPRTERGGDGLVAVPKPFQGDEDIAAPKTIHTGGSVRMRSPGGGVAELLIENKLVVG